ncbi:MAG: hypothetical protein ACRET0_02150 [Steroidobacteraceae bacterium]
MPSSSTSRSREGQRGDVLANTVASFQLHAFSGVALQRALHAIDEILVVGEASMPPTSRP